MNGLAVLLRDWVYKWDDQKHGDNTAVIQKIDGRGGVIATTNWGNWDRRTHGKGTAVKRKSDGRRGVVSWEGSGKVVIKFAACTASSGRLR